jgi:engulfment/cell motility protein 1
MLTDEFLLRVVPSVQAVYEQNSRPIERRCPVAMASNEVVELLSEHWSIFAPGCKSITNSS